MHGKEDGEEKGRGAIWNARDRQKKRRMQKKRCVGRGWVGGGWGMVALAVSAIISSIALMVDDDGGGLRG